MNAYSFPERHEPAHQHHDQIRLPRPIVYMFIGLMLFALVTVTLARHYQIGVTHEGMLHPERQVVFTMAGSDGGALSVTRSDGLVVPLAEAKQEIFPRLILRSIANIRLREGVPLSAPLELDVMPDQERMIIDPATRRSLRLAAFGSENQHVLDGLLAGKAAR